METITLCGSMRFEKQMKEIAWNLEIQYGFCVLQCVYNEQNELITEEMIDRLNEAHLEKINLSSAIYVVDIDNYIGEAVQNEILFAKQNGKKVIYHSEFMK